MRDHKEEGGIAKSGCKTKKKQKKKTKKNKTGISKQFQHSVERKFFSKRETSKRRTMALSWLQISVCV